MRVAPFVVVSLALASCVSAYKEPPTSAASASVTFARHDTVPRWGFTQTLHVVGDETCSTRTRVKDFVPLGSQEPHAFRVDAGARRFFFAETTHTQGGAHGFTDSSCAAVVSFTPVAGGAYTLRQSYRPQCSVEIVDARTGEPAPGFVAYPFVRSCVSIW